MPVSEVIFLKRILICASRISHVLNFHLPYLEYFKQQGYIIDVAAQGTTDNVLIDNCYDMQFVKNPLSPTNLKTISRLKKLMKQNRYSLVYSNSTLAGAAARMAVRSIKKDRPHFVHISHGYMFSEKGGMKSFIYKTAEKLTAPQCDDLVVMNSDDLFLATKYRLGKSLHYIYGMGLCADRFPEITDEQRVSARNRIKVAKNQKLLLCVGEFSKRKNQTLLIRAFDLIHKQHPDTVLAFAGSGKTEDECRSLCEQLELQNSVRFLGQVSDVNTLYRSCDLLLAASAMEGLPFNVMEALYCSVPVAASRIKGHTDLLEGKDFGVLFDNNTASAAEAINRILGDEKLFSDMKAKARLDEKYMIENVKPALLQILDKNYRRTAAGKAEEGAYT